MRTFNGKRLILAKMKTIALFFETNGEFGREFLKGVAKFAHEKSDCRPKLLQLSEITPTSFTGCDGIITRVGTEETTGILKATGLPIVDGFCQLRDSALVGVDSDHVRIAGMAAHYFLSHGFKSFAFCGYEGTGYSDALRDAFARTVGEAGFECAAFSEPEPPIDAAFTDEWPRKPKNSRHLATWLAKLPRQTALFCATDLRAYHALRILLDSGRPVPGDIAIMGVDNDPVICSCAPVELSSIDPNAFGIGYAAARLLDSALSKPVAPKERPIFYVRPGELYERESTRVFPVKPAWFAKVLATVHGCVSKALTAKDLAKMAGVSQTALQKAFQKKFKTSVGKYILDMKMREARRMIETGELQIKEIASRLGFSSLAYFSHTYSSYFGEPPSNNFRKGADSASI